MDEVDLWLKLLFEHTEGYIELRGIHDDEKHAPWKEMCATTFEAATIISEWRQKDHINVFAGACTREDPAAPGLKNNLKHAGSLWIDVDDAHALVDLNQKLIEFGREPTMVVNSGGGRHVYWVLEEPEDVVQKNGIAMIEAANRGLINYFGADPGCFDATRIMRVPGTTNWPFPSKVKAGRRSARCTIEHTRTD